MYIFFLEQCDGYHHKGSWCRSCETLPHCKLWDKSTDRTVACRVCTTYQSIGWLREHKFCYFLGIKKKKRKLSQIWSALLHFQHFLVTHTHTFFWWLAAEFWDRPNALALKSTDNLLEKHISEFSFVLRTSLQRKLRSCMQQCPHVEEAFSCSVVFQPSSQTTGLVIQAFTGQGRSKQAHSTWMAATNVRKWASFPKAEHACMNLRRRPLAELIKKINLAKSDANAQLLCESTRLH